MPERIHPKNRVFVPSDFSGIIQHIPEGCPLVGGQAVAWWQQQYCPSDAPITSCDIDFWGHRADLDTLAKALGRRPLYPHKYEMTVWVGGIALNINGENTLVEFINSVPGLDIVAEEKASIPQLFSTGDTEKKLLVLSPVSLALSKLHALRAFDQDDRQDELHLKTSLATADRFIEQLLQESQIKQALWNVERLIAASQYKPYRRLQQKHGFEILSAVPVKRIQEAAECETLPEADLNRLRNFQTSRWPEVVERASSADHGCIG
jgi:hypothetical protein